MRVLHIISEKLPSLTLTILNMKQTITFPVAIGDEVRDRVTGFQGIVVALTEWFNRCQRASVQPRVEEGKMSVPMAEAFDVEQLDIITENKIKQKPDHGEGKNPNGPTPNVSDRRTI